MRAHRHFLIGLSMVLSAASDLSAETAALRCASARDAITATICGTPEYVAMDREIGALTDRAMARFSTEDQQRLAQSQKLYLRRRQGCDWASHHSAHPGAAVDECVRASLDDRVRALRVLVERGRF